MLRLALLLSAVLLAGCASAPSMPPPDVARVLHDGAFAPPSQPVDAGAVFGLSDEMRAYVDQHRSGRWRAEDPREFLIDMLYRRQKLGLEYDSAITRTAAQAFEARRGNCLSLVIMTAAFAKALNVPVRYQRVLVSEVWSRAGSLQFASGHVNLALPEGQEPGRVNRSLTPTMVIDFIPSEETRRYPGHPIGEPTIIAMFMNNRAAEALAQGHVDDAYWWAREAVRQDPLYTNAYNTLGVVYLRHGLAREASDLFDQVLLREPENTKVMGNLVAALRQQGRTADADRVAAALKAIEPVPPFHHFNAGLKAMEAGDWEKARDLFRAELRRESYYHEIHFWLALAELRLGNLRTARAELELARTQSTTPEQQQIYAAKLDWLKQTYR